MKQHITRAYNSFKIDAGKGIITKRSKELRLKNEINYYKEICNTSNSIFFPRYIRDLKDKKSYSLELEYYAYDNLGDYMVYGTFEYDFWENVATSLNSVLDRFSQTKKNNNYNSYARAMYIDKTQKYYTELLQNEKFGRISKLKNLTINGKNYLNFEHIWDNVKGRIENDLLSLNSMSIIHGDLCFSNILCGINTKTDTCILKFVDPRGHFGEDGIYGDPLYDYAKLIHSFDGGYEYIIYDQFELQESEDLSSFTIRFSNNNKDNIWEVFRGFSKFNSSKAKLIEGLIYIGMCSRHYDSESRQTVMYMNGIKLLNEALENENMR